RAGTVPQVVLIFAPYFGGQQAAFVTTDLVEIAEVVPLGEDQPRFQLAGVIDEHFIEGSLVRNLREAEHLPPQRRRFVRLVPSNDFRKDVLVDVSDLELLAQLLAIEPLAEIRFEVALTMLAETVVAIEVVDDVPVDAAFDAAFRPGLE